MIVITFYYDGDAIQTLRRSHIPAKSECALTSQLLIDTRFLRHYGSHLYTVLYTYCNYYI